MERGNDEHKLISGWTMDGLLRCVDRWLGPHSVCAVSSQTTGEEKETSDSPTRACAMFKTFVPPFTLTFFGIFQT